MGVDLFLKLSKNGAAIKGECADQHFGGMIQLDSFDMSSLSLLNRAEARPPAPLTDQAEPKSAPAEEAAGDDACSFTVKKALDASSADLFLNYTEAQNPERRKACLLRATVYFRHDGTPSKSASADAVSFLVLDFLDVFVYDYNLRGDSEDRRPKEEIKFYFDKYTMTYRDPHLVNGVALKPPARVGWDFAANQQL